MNNALFHIEDNSTSGPDGLNAKKFKHHWEQVKDDIWNAMLDVQSSSKIIKEISHSFNCLISKKPDPESISDHRPVSLCNVTYKILANLLCNRMEGLLNDLISMNQNAYAFFSGRIIIENSLLVYEMVSSFNRNNSSNLCLKIDLHKAHDKINGSFIHFMLIKMGFSHKFANLIYECIITPSFSVSVNGSPIGFL